MLCVLCRDLTVDEAVELGQRSIYHATFRDAASGGTVSGERRATDAGPSSGMGPPACTAACIVLLRAHALPDALMPRRPDLPAPSAATLGLRSHHPSPPCPQCTT